jgi:hypothetical protein
MYEFNYNGTDTEFKIWIEVVDDVEITLIDGIRVHPWVDPLVMKEQFVTKAMSEEDIHEFGDSWYNYTVKSGRAFLFLKSTSNAAAATFSYGYKPLFPKWVIYAAAAAGGTVLILCLILCFWFIRRQARKKADEDNKVKKYSKD